MVTFEQRWQEAVNYLTEKAEELGVDPASIVAGDPGVALPASPPSIHVYLLPGEPVWMENSTGRGFQATCIVACQSAPQSDPRAAMVQAVQMAQACAGILWGKWEGVVRFRSPAVQLVWADATRTVIDVSMAVSYDG